MGCAGANENEGQLLPIVLHIVGFALGVDFKEAADLNSFDREFKSGNWNLH